MESTEILEIIFFLLISSDLCHQQMLLESVIPITTHEVMLVHKTLEIICLHVKTLAYRVLKNLLNKLGLRYSEEEKEEEEVWSVCEILVSYYLTLDVNWYSPGCTLCLHYVEVVSDLPRPSPLVHLIVSMTSKHAVSVCFAYVLV